MKESKDHSAVADAGGVQGPAQLGMSMFASSADYLDAVEAREGYSPVDAFADGEHVRNYGGAQNPYDEKTQPVCFAAWRRGLTTKVAP